MDEHKITINALYERLNSSKYGLTNIEAQKRRDSFGPNLFAPKAPVSLFLRFIKHLFNPFALLLWMGALLASIAETLAPGEGNLYLALILCITLFFNAAFSFYQEFQSERIIESFHTMIPSTIEVLRDGIRQEIQSKELVPGDIIYLEEGKRIPADGRIIALGQLKVDHSSLTGESEPQLRSLNYTHDAILASRNMVFSGTLVVSGHGIAIVCKTGAQTQIGTIAELTKKSRAASSPLREEIKYFTKIISFISILISTTFLGISLFSGNTIIGSLLFAIGILVANIPEGLLPTVTLCLRMSAQKMAKKKALIKRLESVETLGSTTVICTDKTGTLTENKASVQKIFLNLEEITITKHGMTQLLGFSDLLLICTLCNNAHLSASHGIQGDPIDVALLTFASKYIHIEEIIKKYPRIHEVPFDSTSRKMLTINREKMGKKSFLKGSPEMILESCHYILEQGKIVPLSVEKKEKIYQYFTKFAAQGDRVLGLAYNDLTLHANESYIFVALLGLLDPPRKGVSLALSTCHKAGIKVIMITGDSSTTAQAIGTKIGLGKTADLHIMLGEELEKSSDDQLVAFLKHKCIIFARTTPIQKFRIVKTLQSMNEIVTVTGDGVNDAPALRQAHMGVAMGLSGTDVAKEAADMVLMDDHFATIVHAIEEGRTVFENIQKFITYVLSHLMPEIVPFIAFVILPIPLALPIIFIFLIDLGTDILPALGLGIERPEQNVMIKRPRARDERLLTAQLIVRSYCIIGIIESIAGFSAYFTVLYSHHWSWGTLLAPSDPLYQQATTAFFVTIIFCQIANVLACRTERQSLFKKGLFSNHLILWGIFIESLFVYLLVTNSFFKQIFNTHALEIKELLVATTFALFIFLFEEVKKFFLRKRSLYPQL